MDSFCFNGIKLYYCVFKWIPTFFNNLLLCRDFFLICNFLLVSFWSHLIIFGIFEQRSKFLCKNLLKIFKSSGSKENDLIMKMTLHLWSLQKVYFKNILHLKFKYLNFELFEKFCAANELKLIFLEKNFARYCVLVLYRKNKIKFLGLTKIFRFSIRTRQVKIQETY